MKLSESFFYTLRENAKDEETVSGNLLVRAGMIRKSSSGVYMLLPLGLRAIRKIEAIIREEMEAVGSQELSMPALIPEEVYIESGRRAAIGSSMFTLKDRFERDFVLGPTHEELFASAARMAIRSYKDLPISLFQFQTKFRDEPRPRFGLIRVREFTMKDAYSFDADQEGLDRAYAKMFEAYCRAFDRIGLRYRVVRADTGVMGGQLSEEFQAECDIGEDILVLHDASGYASNLEVASCLPEGPPSDEAHLPSQVVDTPNARTIEEVAAFLGHGPDRFVKTLIYLVDDQPVALLVRGDHDVNETKVRKYLDAVSVEMAPADIVERATGAPVGFAGPIGLKIPVLVDQEVARMANFIVGANQPDRHIVNANLESFDATRVADIRNIRDGDLCENGQGRVRFARGIEIGNTFKLGDKYSLAMGLTFADSENHTKPVIMGSYGIGPGRCLAALVEQNHTDKGILWPKAIAPIQVAILVINTANPAQMTAAEQIYQSCLRAGYDVLLDDREERAGVKFNDMDLIGAYVRVTCGKALEQNQVEIKISGSDDKELVPLAQAGQRIAELLA